MLTFEEERSARTGTALAPSTGVATAAAAVAEHRPRVLGLCRRILGGRASPEDACQEALTRAVAALPRFDARAPMWPWLATIAANVCRDLLRAERPVESLDADLDATATPGPEEAAMARARATLVHDALASMPTQYQAALYLRDIEGWSYAEIAELGGRSVAAVRTTLMRGRRILASRIERLARERRQWPLAAAGGAGAWLRRVRAWMAQLPSPLQAVLAAPLQLAEALRGLGWAAAGLLGPAVAAAAVAGLTLAPSPSTEPARSVVGQVVAPAGQASTPTPAATGPEDGRERAPAATPAPATVQVAQAQARADGDARVATPGVTVGAAPPPTAADEPREQVSDGTVQVGPVGLYCGSADRRREAMATVCQALAG